MAVKHVRTLLTEEPHERQEAAQIELEASIELEHTYPGRPNLIQERRIRRARDAERSVEGPGIEPLHQLRGHAFAAPAAGEPVDDRDDTNRSPLGTGGDETRIW